jgi:hypothetical protein
MYGEHAKDCECRYVTVESYIDDTDEGVRNQCISNECTCGFEKYVLGEEDG